MSEPDRIRIQQRRASQVPRPPSREAHEPDLEGSAPAVRPEDLAAPASLGPTTVERIARSAGNAATASLLEGVEVADLLPDTGRPLDPELAARMGAAYGTSFDDVRVHSGPTAAANAAALEARAYTIGSDIVQGESGSDEHTMAHELAHVVQNRGGSPAVGAGGGRVAGGGGGGVARFGLEDLGGIASMAGPMLGMIPGLGGVGNAIGGVGNAVGGGGGGLGGMLGGLGNMLGGALGGGGDILGAVGNAAGGMLSGGSPAGALGGLGNMAGGALGSALGGGGDILSGVGGVLGNAAGGGGGLVSGLEGVGENALGGLAGGAGNMLGGLTGLLGGLF